jgi:thiol-disulfide isomerase/thioredoxin
MKSFIIALFFPLCCVAQQPKPLQIGDTLPVQAWKQLNSTNFVNSSGPSPFGGPQGARNRLIILDFFASWCAPCIRKFPFLDSMQSRFHDELQILLVSSIGTTDNEERLNKFFARYKRTDGTPWQFHLIINDTILVKLFPHRIVPHYVWLCNNRVVAITGSASVTIENITALLGHQPLSLPVKDDELESKTKPSKSLPR